MAGGAAALGAMQRSAAWDTGSARSTFRCQREHDRTARVPPVREPAGLRLPAGAGSPASQTYPPARPAGGGGDTWTARSMMVVEDHGWLARQARHLLRSRRRRAEARVAELEAMLRERGEHDTTSG